MEITPRTIRDVVFRERLRGYDEDDVDGFLERVATGVEILQERLRQAVERAELAERRASEMVEGDDAMRRTLMLAQRTADLAVEEGKAQGARILEEAGEHGRQIVGRAQELARRQAVEAQEQLRRDLAQLEAARQQMRSDVAAFERYLEGERSRLRLALGDAIRWIEEGIPSLVPSPVAHDTPLPPHPDRWAEWEVPAISTGPEAAEPQAAEPQAAEPEEEDVPPKPVPDPATALWPWAQSLSEPAPPEAPVRPDPAEAEAVAPRVFAMPPPEQHEHGEQHEHEQQEHDEQHLHEAHVEHEHAAHDGHDVHDEHDGHDEHAEQLEAETDAPAPSEDPPHRQWRAWWRRAVAGPGVGELAPSEDEDAPEPAGSEAPGAPGASGVAGEHPGDGQYPHSAGPYDHVGSP